MRAVIALGANIGDPKEQIELAVALLRESLDVISVSSLYTTAPVGKVDQPDFTNAVLIAESELPALELLSLLHGIEKALGRERVEKWGPRTIDLDLIQYGELELNSDGITLPHPRAHERRFVLEPWAQIDPDAYLVGVAPIRELLSQLPPEL